VPRCLALTELEQPVSLVFLSCDLTGSTNFKQRQDLTAPWQKVFLQFYREFPQRVAITQVALGTKNLTFELWKPIGDELIYSCAVRSEEDVYNAIRTWLKAMRDYEYHSLDDTSMGTKGGPRRRLAGGQWVARSRTQLAVDEFR
jgi:hypothetical protein